MNSLNMYKCDSEVVYSISITRYVCSPTMHNLNHEFAKLKSGNISIYIYIYVYIDIRASSKHISMYNFKNDASLDV